MDGILSAEQIALLRRIHLEGMFHFAHYGARDYYWGKHPDSFAPGDGDELTSNELKVFKTLFRIETKKVFVGGQWFATIVGDTVQHESIGGYHVDLKCFVSEWLNEPESVERDDYFEYHIGLIARHTITDKALALIGNID